MELNIRKNDAVPHGSCVTTAVRPVTAIFVSELCEKYAYAKVHYIILLQKSPFLFRIGERHRGSLSDNSFTMLPMLILVSDCLAGLDLYSTRIQQTSPQNYAILPKKNQFSGQIGSRVAIICKQNRIV